MSRQFLRRRNMVTVFQIFSPSRSQPHHSSFFVTTNVTAIIRRERGVECTGYEKIAIFDQYLALSP